MTMTLFAPPVYTDADQTQWWDLFIRQRAAVADHAYSAFAGSLTALGLHPDHIPACDEVNSPLQQLTGWKVYPLPSAMPDQQFFRLMVFRRFGITGSLRKVGQTGPPDEPDLFHHFFGHLPLLADPRVAGYLHQLVLIAERFIDLPTVVQQIARLYRHTIEYGLVREAGAIKIYGAGILSSLAATQHCLSPAASRGLFDLSPVLATPPAKGPLQPQYFVLASIGQLDDIICSLDQLLRSQLG
jgi:phenylalanine-4-hydroxylase